MKHSIALLLCLLLPTIAISQSKPILERLSALEFEDAQERDVAYKSVDGENKLVVVGNKAVRVFDITNGTLLSTVPLSVPEYNEDRPREISPDGRRMIVFGNYGSRKKEDKIKRPPSVWDLETGKQIATLDKTAKPIRAAIWSKNGKTLVTSSDRYAPRFTDSTPVEVSFWDGETIQYKNSLPTGKTGWWHLSDDGQKCIYSTTDVLNLIVYKEVTSVGPLNVWDITVGKIEETITGSQGNVERKIRGIDVSPDGKFLIFVAQPPKSAATERHLSVWEIDDSGRSRLEIRPKYEIRPDPKLSEYGAMFSPSGKYFALDVDKNLQIYETRTGKKRVELLNFRSPFWLTDDIVYRHHGNSMTAFDLATGKQIYEQRLIFDYTTHTRSTSYDPDGMTFEMPEIEVLDQTELIAHPSGTITLAFSKQYVELYDSRSGELLQTLVSPPMDYTKKKPRLSSKPLVYKAGWSSDGNTLFLISADKNTISFWRLLLR